MSFIIIFKLKKTQLKLLNDYLLIKIGNDILNGTDSNLTLNYELYC